MTPLKSLLKFERLEAELWTMFFVAFASFAFCGGIEYITSIDVGLAKSLSFIYGIGMPMVLFLFKGDLIEQIIYYAFLCLVFVVFSCMALLNGGFSGKSDLFYFAGYELFIDSIFCLIVFSIWLVGVIRAKKKGDEALEVS